jgi:hypothetical protein
MVLDPTANRLPFVLLLLALAAPARAGGLVDPFQPFGWSPVGPQVNSQFGFSVAPAGDVNGDGFGDVLVGGFGETNQFTGEGRAHLFLGSPTGVSPTAFRDFYPEQVGAAAGFSVSSAGDVNGDGYSDFLVGVPLWNSQSFADVGKVMVYYGGANVPFVPSTELLSPAPAAAQEFGRVLAPAGDVNGDGYDDVLVGTGTYAEGGFTGRGAAWVFHGGPSGLSATPARTWIGAADNGQFGSALSPAGDVNGDGYADVLVAAPQASVGFAQNGVTYLYLGSAAGALAAPDTAIAGTEAGESCGAGVGNAGDVNGDGYADVLVGSPNFGANNEGRCRLLYGGPGGIASGVFLANTEVAANEFFGRLCATVGDLDGDGFADFAVTSRYVSGGGNGRVVVYRGGRNAVSVIGDILTPPRVSGYFGNAIAASGDTDGDGLSEILVGTEDWSVMPGFFEGRAFSFVPPRTMVRANNGWPRQGPVNGTWYGSALAFVPGTSGGVYPLLVIGDPHINGKGRISFHPGGIFNGISQNELGFGLGGSAVGQDLGERVADVGDVNGDGYSDLIVSSPGSVNQRGRVDFLAGSITGLPPAGATVLSGGTDFDRVGSSLGGRGDVNGDGYQDFVVGTNMWNSATLAECGRAWLFLGSASGPVASAWSREGTIAGQGLGAGVALADLDADGYSDVVVGSSPPEGSTNPAGGKVEVFYGGPSGPPLTPGLVLTADTPEESYGWTVASLGDVNGDGVCDLGVGAPRYNGGRGAVFVYGGSLGRSQGQRPLRRYEGVEAFQSMGWAIAGGGDVDGDGFGDFAIGSPGYSGGKTNQGRLDLYQGAPLLPSPNPAFSFTSGVMSAQLGAAIAPLADGNLDGFADVAVGAPRAEGRVYVFLGGTGPGHVATLALFEPNVGSLRRFPPARVEVPDGVRGDVQYASPGGRAKAEVQFEAVTQDTPFSGVPTQRTGYVHDSGAPDDGAGLLSSAIRAFPQINLPWPGTAYHVRARFATRSPFFPRSRWVTPEARTSGDLDVRTSGSVTGVLPRAASAVGITGVAPNPARRGANSRIDFALARAGRVVLDVFDVRGARIARLLDGERPAGPSSLAWDGRDDAGRATAAGLYFAVLTIEGRSSQTRVVRLP